MNTQESIDFITNIIQEYTKQLESTNPALAYALANTSNIAIAQIVNTIVNRETTNIDD